METHKNESRVLFSIPSRGCESLWLYPGFWVILRTWKLGLGRAIQIQPTVSLPHLCSPCVEDDHSAAAEIHNTFRNECGLQGENTFKRLSPWPDLIFESQLCISMAYDNLVAGGGMGLVATLWLSVTHREVYSGDLYQPLIFWFLLGYGLESHRGKSWSGCVYLLFGVDFVALLCLNMRVCLSAYTCSNVSCVDRIWVQKWDVVGYWKARSMCR